MIRVSRPAAGLAFLSGLVVFLCLLRLLIDRDPSGVVSLAWPAPGYARFRWVSMANAAIAGAALGVSGMLLQALLRNPLASPWVLGVSSGAGLGVMATLYAAWIAGSPTPAVAGATAPAMAGAMGVLALVYTLSQRRGALDPLTLILVGVVISTICAAGIMFFQHLVPTGLRGEFTSWLMGYIPEDTAPREIAMAGAFTLLGTGVAITVGHALDVAALGDDEARSLGLALGPIRLAMFTLAGTLAAVAVAVVGPIGFVGLIAPHAARLLAGSRHRALAAGSALVGAALLVGADIARQALDFGAGRMPPGVFTALLGGPLFIALLLSRRS